MAILKHIASKNANYGSAIDYLKYQHDEFHLVPVLDENGNMMLREEFYIVGQLGSFKTCPAWMVLFFNPFMVLISL